MWGVCIISGRDGEKRCGVLKVPVGKIYGFMIYVCTVFVTHPVFIINFHNKS